MNRYDRTDYSNLLIKQLSHKIIIEISPALFTFISSDKTLELPTYVYVTTQKGYAKVVSVGKEATTELDSFKVELFKNKTCSSHKVDICECLEAFIKHGVLQVISRYAIVPPTIIFRNIQLFHSLFHGYQKGLFNLIANRACAGAVFFE